MSAEQTIDIVFKTISQQTFKLTLPLAATIVQVKEKIFNEKGDEFAADRQKLIYNGKILEDGEKLEDIKVDEKKYVVVMMSRKKIDEVEKPAAEQAVPSASVATPATSGSVSTPSATLAEIRSDDHVPPEHQNAVASICAMGYPRDQVVSALRAAFFNADRAVEYLLTGIPEESPAGGPAEIEADNEAEVNPLEFLRHSPQFSQICQIVRSNPEMLQQVLAEISQSNPDLMQIIRDNQQRFVQMLNEGVVDENMEGEEGGPINEQPAHEAGHVTIAVTEDDRQALQRLQAMGFPEQLVIEAYFACDKNEDLAVNYILSRLDEGQ